MRLIQTEPGLTLLGEFEWTDATEWVKFSSAETEFENISGTKKIIVKLESYVDTLFVKVVEVQN